ncbi:uncharacterized protein RCC_09558 [Ramularia collo-cygni]|uniref:Uncharacterized protein n=1 Tax=Ramularia collo-cygni TaxID=112498 RepID=A0A2D3VM95_9PEZI|nr:uncharacterized protein RCC_09558 [Ramularia collo-cygni]CZT23844.1 uncharacterized protein RCC_09558 [Ramularia collo-cygni]
MDRTLSRFNGFCLISTLQNFPKGKMMIPVAAIESEITTTNLEMGVLSTNKNIYSHFEDRKSKIENIPHFHHNAKSSTSSPQFPTCAFAAKYAPGQACYSSKQCNANCLDSDFVVTHEDGDSFLACNAKAANPKQFYHATCLKYDPQAVGASPIVFNKAGTAAACGKIAGGVMSCKAGCLLSGTRSTEQDLRRKWQLTCTGVENEVFGGKFVAFSDEAEARYEAYCA